MVLWVRLLQVIPISILFMIIFWQIPNRDASSQTQDRAGVLFILMTNQIFMASFSALNLFAAERGVFQREHDARMYGLPAYFMAKSIIDVPILFIVPFLMASIVYFAVGLQATFSHFITTVACMVLLTGCGHSLGLWAAATFANVNIALAVMPLLILPMMIFSGLFVNIATLPVWIAWIKWLSPMKYGFVALMTNEFTGLTLPCPINPANIPNCTVSGSDVLTQYGLSNQGSLAVNMIALLGFCGLLWTLAYICFYLMVKRSKGTFKAIPSHKV